MLRGKSPSPSKRLESRALSGVSCASTLAKMDSVPSHRKLSSPNTLISFLYSSEVRTQLFAIAKLCNEAVVPVACHGALLNSMELTLPATKFTSSTTEMINLHIVVYSGR